MEKQLFTNEIILSWLQYFADNTPIDLEQIKMMDITKRNKNLIPTVESHKAVLAFMEAGDAEIFYHMWNAGLGDCEVWYNEGSEPSGAIKHDKVSDMINRGINASAGMLVVNPNARNTYKSGLDNLNLKKGAGRGFGSEIRSIILNKMHIGREDTVCAIGGESIAIESAFLASEGTVIAVEYNQAERDAMEENIDYFDLRNVTVIDHVDEDSLAALPVPDVVFLTASASMEQEIQCLMHLNPQLNIVVYTLDLGVAGTIRGIFEKYGIKEAEVIQVAVSKLNAKNAFELQPAPWIITGKREG
jgi:precorrin-6Y C5,15-methyltransferase (decarboxylating)